MSHKHHTIRRQPQTRPVFAGMRRHRRHEAALDILVLDEQGWEIPFDSADVSQSGVFLRSSYLFDVGTTHTLVIQSTQGDVVVRTKAQVVRLDDGSVDGRSGMAYEFVDTDARNFDGISQIMSAL